VVDNVGFGRSRSASTTSFSKTNEGLSFIFFFLFFFLFIYIHFGWHCSRLFEFLFLLHAFYPLSCALIDFGDTSLMKGGSVHVGFPGEDRSLHFLFNFFFIYYPSPRLLGGCVLKKLLPCYR